MNHDGPYHPGELEVQARAGASSMARRVGGSIHAVIPPAAAAFLAERREVVVATSDDRGRPWASVLSGPPGFVRVFNDQQLRLAARPLELDPLRANLSAGPAHAGLLAIDLSTRRRMRLNGRLAQLSDGTLGMEAEQVFANCPKYIQRREELPDEKIAAAPPSRVSRTLGPAQVAWIRRADTFFIATANPGEGADASHRGGRPGFLSVEGDTLRWVDYSGNMMFTTLGNIAAHPWAGLAIPDFETGDLLQVSGPAQIEWGEPSSDGTVLTNRRVTVRVEGVIQHHRVWPATGHRVEYSPFNPAPESAA